MKEPWFWRETGLAARTASSLLLPAAALYDAAQILRAAIARPQSAAAPVVCIGNATLGGVGKTPFALMLRDLLRSHGLAAHFASRGFGGSISKPTQVSPSHTAFDVGDEPLLLAASAPTFVSRNRLDGVRAASAGADLVIMDDGFQNPAIRKDCSILLVNADDPCGNGRIFPAGPLREPLTRATARADAVIALGGGELEFDVSGKPAFRASRQLMPAVGPQKAVAFCGIGDPSRFFNDLEGAGFTLAARYGFADHHFYREAELTALRRAAKRESAILITTEKDWVRLEPEARQDIAVARLSMTLDKPDALASLVIAAIGATR